MGRCSRLNVTSTAPPARRFGLEGLLELVSRPVLGPRAALAWAALGSVIVCLRASDRLFAPAFWAEDAMIFLKEAHDAGPAAIGHAYAGYLLLFPRVASVLSVELALRWAPLAFALCALVAMLAGWWRIAASSLPIPGKALWVVLPALLPNNGENALTLVNAQWVVTPLLVVLACERSQDTRRSLADAAWLVVLGLSGPFLMLLSVLFVPRAWAGRRRWGEWVVVAAVLATSAVQAWTFVHSQRDTSGGAFDERHLTYPLLNGASGLLAGLAEPLEGPAAWALAVVLLVGLGAALWGMRPEARPFALTGLLAAGALVAASMLALRRVPMAFHPFGAGRYTWVPYVFVSWILLCGAFGQRAAVRWSSTLLLLVVVSSGLRHFTMSPRPPLDWAEVMRRYDTQGQTSFVVPPANWTVELRQQQRH